MFLWSTIAYYFRTKLYYVLMVKKEIRLHLSSFISTCVFLTFNSIPLYYYSVYKHYFKSPRTWSISHSIGDIPSWGPHTKKKCLYLIKMVCICKINVPLKSLIKILKFDLIANDSELKHRYITIFIISEVFMPLWKQPC